MVVGTDLEGRGATVHLDPRVGARVDDEAEDVPRVLQHAAAQQHLAHAERKDARRDAGPPDARAAPEAVQVAVGRLRLQLELGVEDGVQAPAGAIGLVIERLPTRKRTRAYYLAAQSARVPSSCTS